jgi:hypothetical protein
MMEKQCKPSSLHQDSGLQHQHKENQCQYQYQLHPFIVSTTADGADMVAGAGVGVRRPGRWAKKTDWDAHRRIITSLYRDRGLTLKSVKDTMEREYHFFSS